MWLQNARGHHQDPYKFLTPILPGEPCSAKHTTDYEPGSSNFQNFSAVWRSMWVRNIHHSHKEIAGLSQVTWAAIHWPRANAFSTKKISIYIYIYTYIYACACARVCEVPLRTFYVCNFTNIYAKHEFSGFHSFNVRIPVFWNGKLSSWGYRFPTFRESINLTSLNTQKTRTLCKVIGFQFLK